MSDTSAIDTPSPSPPEPYSVGYARPPQEHRFRKGTSGNPKGRPRKAAPPAGGKTGWGEADFDQLVLDEFRKPVTATENGKKTTTTTIEGLLKCLRVQALAGDRPSQLRLTHMFSSAQRRVRQAREQAFTTAVKHRADAIAMILQAREEGRPDTTIVPHPLDIVLDPFTLEVKFNGPMTHEENADWEESRQWREEQEVEIAAIEMVIEPGSDDEAADLKRIALLRKMVRRSAALFPDAQTRRRRGFDLVAWRTNQLGPKELGRLLSQSETD